MHHKVPKQCRFHSLRGVPECTMESRQSLTQTAARSSAPINDTKTRSRWRLAEFCLTITSVQIFPDRQPSEIYSPNGEFTHIWSLTAVNFGPWSRYAVFRLQDINKHVALKTDAFISQHFSEVKQERCW